MKALFLLLSFLSVTTCGLAQVMKQRLIAQAQYVGVDTIPGGSQYPTMYDSVLLTYGSTRHSSFDYNAMEYADLNPMYENKYSLLDKLNRIIVPNNIDSAYSSVRLAFDSMYYFGMGGPSVPTQIAAMWYYPDGRVMDAYNNSNYSPPVQFVRHSGRLAVARYASAVYGFSRFFRYDFSGNVVADSASTGQLFVYEFDTSGRYLACTEYRNNVLFEQKAYSYLPDGKVNARIAGNILDSFFYTPGVPGYTSSRSYSYAGGVPGAQPVFRYETHVNSLGQKDSLFYFDASNTLRSSAWLTYDSKGNPLSKTILDPVFTSGGIEYRFRRTKYFYHEDYNPSLSIASIIESPISLSPNPTTGTINLHYSGAKTGAELRVLIYNTTGQIISSTTSIAQDADARLSLPEAAAAGLYYIRVLDGRNCFLYASKFVKL